MDRFRLILFFLILFPSTAFCAVNVGTTWGFWGDSQTAGRAPLASGATSSPEAIESVSPVSSPTAYSNGLSGCSLLDSNGRYDAYASKAGLTWVHFQESGNQNLTGQTTSSAFGSTFETVMANIHTDSPNAVISYETAFSFGREAEEYRNWTDYNTQLRTSINTLAGSGITVILCDVDTAIKALVAHADIEAVDVWYQTGDENEYHYTEIGNLMVALTVWASLGYDVSTFDFSGVADIASGDIAIAVGIAVELATPSISNAVLSDGVLTLTGLGFGTNTAATEWIGGDIEVGTNGLTPTISGWIFDGETPTVTTSQAHSGTKSITGTTSSETGYASSLRYDYGSTITAGSDVFVSWWVRRTHTGDGQWKMFRLNWRNDIQDDYPQVAMFNNDSGYNDDYFIIRPGPTTTSSDDTVEYPAYLETDNEWVRYDLYVKESTIGNSDGSFSLYMHRPGSGITLLESGSNVMTYYSDVRLHRWFLWQNYMGNGITALQYWIDDIYIQVGSQARIEIGNNAVFESCTHREIQPSLTWDGTEITGTYNIGSFTESDDIYVFVVDADGVASDGFLLESIGYDAPVVTILTESQSTTAATITIVGTLTTDSELTGTGVDVNGGGATSSDGFATWSVVVPLSLGANTITATGTDSNSGTDTDIKEDWITRTEQVTVLHGSGGIKNAVIH